MRLPRRNILKRWRRLTLRGALLFGLLPKLLVPAGFMPAALADGGPIVVCGSDTWPAALRSGSAPAAMDHSLHAGMTPHAGTTQHADTTAHAGATERAGMTLQASEDEHEQHRQWERCIYAGAASSTPLAVDWHIDLLPRAADAVAQFTPFAISRSHSFAYRSRAPPISHS